MNELLGMYTEAHKSEKRRIIGQQGISAIRGEPIKCGGCETKMAPWRMYKCFHCGVFYCDECGKIHFGPDKGQTPNAPQAQAAPPTEQPNGTGGDRLERAVRHGSELSNGLTLLQQNPDYAADLRLNSQYYGWLFVRGLENGKWTSHRKLAPWEIMQAEDQRDLGIVKQGAMVRAG